MTDGSISRISINFLETIFLSTLTTLDEAEDIDIKKKTKGWEHPLNKIQSSRVNYVSFDLLVGFKSFSGNLGKFWLQHPYQGFKSFGGNYRWLHLVLLKALWSEKAISE